MMRYEDENGDIYEGETAADVVRQMSRSKLSKTGSLRKYMRGTARRIREMTDLTVDSSSCNLFLKSLAENNLLKRVD